MHVFPLFQALHHVPCFDVITWCPFQVGVTSRQEVLGKTVAGLQELTVYGLKGTAAYAAHAGRE